MREQEREKKIESLVDVSLDKIRSLIDVFSKCLLAKVKNNKKSAHIFVDVQPKYNEDIFNLRLIYEMRMSVVDIIYTFVYTAIATIKHKLNGRVLSEKR